MTIRGQLQVLIIVRLVVVTLIAAAALSTSVFGPSTSQFLKLFLLAVYILSGIYFLFLSYTDRPEELYGLQFFSDLLLLSVLIYSSGGTASTFSSLYVLVIVYASLIRYRRGAMLAVVLSMISYIGIAHLEYFDWIPNAEPTVYSQLVYRSLWNIMGFIAVALLGSYLSERLQKTRQELGAVKMLHDNIVNSIRTGLMTVDMEGRITSCNRAASEILGRDPNEVMNCSLDLVFPMHIRETIVSASFQPTSRPLRTECWVSWQHADPVFVGMSCSPLISETLEQIGFVLTFQDLTEIRRREEELQLKEKMAAIGQVAAGVAHEIRNPLAALSGSIQILRAELELKPEHAHLIEIVLRECGRLNQTVSDFLTYAGPPPPRFQRIDLVAKVQQTVAFFQKNPQPEHSHPIEIISAPPEAWCLADPDQVSQALWNILQNAVRAMPDGGKIRVRITASRSEVRLSIRDAGIGMTEEEKSKIFQPFHAGFKKGVGLGMAIVYQIMQQHNGRVEIESRRGKGTVVSICFPTIGYTVDPATLLGPISGEQSLN
ncbi:MAG: PAS domain-containing protein [Acidobacteria bacterium]|nr:MAG: PAS domain-containing protein [Acidobacteriota bacterium]